jgi:hypothetical protein
LGGIAKSYARLREKTGFKTDAGTDRFQKPISLFDGDTFYTKVSTKDTDGDLYIYESSRVKKAVQTCISIITRTNGGTFWRVSL